MLKDYCFEEDFWGSGASNYTLTRVKSRVMQHRVLQTCRGDDAGHNAMFGLALAPIINGSGGSL